MLTRRPPRPRRFLIRSLAAGAVALAAVPAAAGAATFAADPAVPDTSPAVCVAVESSGAPCSLRTAMTAATLSSGNTVRLAAGTFTLTQGQLPEITKTMDIVGAGAASTTIDASGNGTPLILFKLDTAATTVNLRALTIDGSKASNTISATGGTMAVEDAVVSHAGGPYTFSIGGATLKLTRVAVLDSPASESLTSGNGATVNIDSSTFARTGDLQAGIAGAATTFTATNSTFDTVGVAPAPALILGFGTAQLAYNTFTGNTGGTLLATTASAAFTLVGNALGGPLTGPAKHCALAVGATFADGGSNVIGDATCPLTAPSSHGATDPGLGGLANNGGPVATIAPLPGSPLINGAAGCPSPAVDARGVARPQGAACDIGAFELRAPVLGGPPALSGSAVVGSTLTCTPQPLVSGEGAPATALAWLRDGTPVAGGATYRTTTADVGHNVACAQATTNGAGTAGADSAALTITAPAAPAPPKCPTGQTGTPPACQAPPAAPRAPKVSATAVRRSLTVIRASHGFLVSVACDVTCAVKATAKLGLTSVGSGGRTVSPGKPVLVRIKLTKAGLKRLKHRRTATFSVTLKATASGKTTSRTIRVTAKR